MANLAISMACNQNCAYCFARDRLAVGATRSFMDIQAYDKILDFLDRSGIKQVRLLGGEPTLHPQLGDLLSLARSRGFRIVVFTNGLISEQALAYLEALDEDECSIMVNANEPTPETMELHRRRCSTLRRLGKRALVGFNIYRSDFRSDFLLSMIGETGCQPVLRLGIAHACLSAKNKYLHPNRYVFVGDNIAKFAVKSAENGVALRFDCGFVRCMFSEENLKTLVELGSDIAWRCNPILDVDVDGRAFHCFPLSGALSLTVGSETRADDLRTAFIAHFHPYRQAGVFKECSICRFKACGECPGGCLSNTMLRFRHTPFALKVSSRSGESPIGDSGHMKEASNGKRN